MGIEFTYFDVAEFDVDYFDYSYTSDTFPADTGIDFDNIMTEIGHDFSIIRQVDTTDGTGAITNITESTFTISGFLVDITKKDRIIHKMGLSNKGERTFFVKDKNLDGDYIQVGDILTDRVSNQWRITQIIQEPYLTGEQIYKKCFIRNIYFSDTDYSDVPTSGFAFTALNDFNLIVLENGDIFSVTKQTDTLDGVGTISSITESNFRLYAYIRDITKKDREVHDMGLSVSGDRIMYVKPFYSDLTNGTTTTYTSNEGDILTDRNGYQWRIVQIVHEPFIGDYLIYKKMIVRNINLEGSE